MARYHFTMCEGGATTSDIEGTELPTVQRARQEALRLAGDLLRDAPDTFWSDPEWRLEVSDGVGMMLFTLTIFGSDAPALRS